MNLKFDLSKRLPFIEMEKMAPMGGETTESSLYNAFLKLAAENGVSFERTCEEGLCDRHWRIIINP